jgi:hypothetical protein
LKTKLEKAQNPMAKMMITFSLILSMSGCSILTIADTAVSAAVDVVGMGVHAATSAVDAILPSPKK